MLFSIFHHCAMVQFLMWNLTNYFELFRLTCTIISFLMEFDNIIKCEWNWHKNVIDVSITQGVRFNLFFFFQQKAKINHVRPHFVKYGLIDAHDLRICESAKKYKDFYFLSPQKVLKDVASFCISCQTAAPDWKEMWFFIKKSSQNPQNISYLTFLSLYQLLEKIAIILLP